MGKRVLADRVTIRPNFQRSVHLERDSGSTVPDKYIPTARSVETLRRFATAMLDPGRARAWSLTGPYGSGKSSFALFLHALAGPARDPRRVAAERVLGATDPEAVKLLREGRHQLHAAEKGFIRAVVTAQREPATQSIMRALELGVRAFWGSPPPDVRRAVLTSKNRSVVTPRQVVHALRTLARHAPVLLVIDEFGKNLEAFTDDGPAGDLFVLQEIAERISGARGLPAFFFTLQHLAFADYASALSPNQRHEWNKAQGRFEDISFLDSADQVLRVLAEAFDHSGSDPDFDRRLNAWAVTAYKACRDLGLSRILGDSPRLVAACYPLHPIATAVLPELCARYAQHSRTLFGFVASPEVGSVRSFLANGTIDNPLPVVTIDAIYEYFLASAGTMIGNSNEGARWLEIERRIRETQGLSGEDLRVLRAIAVLNLVSSGGILRASVPMVEFALDAVHAGHSVLASRLASLEQRGLITYRAFADEYRIWHGSDFDIGAAVAEARQKLAGGSLASLLEEVSPLTPLVAGRHSQRTGTLRYFERHFVDSHSSTLPLSGDADGAIIYLIDDLASSLFARLESDSRPIVSLRSPEPDPLRQAALELAALQDVLSHSESLAQDWVARRELQERRSLALQHLDAMLNHAFRLSQEGADLTLIKTGERLKSAGSLSRLVSDLCDRFYHSSPEVRNEMIARRELTSQGAKARRDLIAAMIRRPHEARHGLTGYGPEYAIYAALLSWPRLHRVAGDGNYGFGPPHEASSWIGAWSAIARLVKEARGRHVRVSEVWETLMAPPIGLKLGPIPILFTSALLYWADDVAIYQDGTYQPQLDAALIERLLKTPERFSIKSFGLAGARLEVLGAVAGALNIGLDTSGRRRNATVLSITAPLLSRLRALPAYTQRTTRLSDAAKAVRETLITSREPDRLLFVDLPRACGFEPFQARPAVSLERARAFATRLRDLLDELSEAYGRLLNDVSDAFNQEFSVPERIGPREDLRSRASHLIGKVIDPSVRSFVVTAIDETLDDGDWLEAMAMNVGGRPPQGWRDDEVAHFRSNVHELASAFARLEALHFEQRSQRREGFDARRITVTSPDGSEVSRVVWTNENLETSLSPVVDAAIKAAERRAGREGGSSLLALLAKRLYLDSEEIRVPGVTLESEEARKNG